MYVNIHGPVLVLREEKSVGFTVVIGGHERVDIIHRTDFFKMLLHDLSDECADACALCGAVAFEQLVQLNGEINGGAVVLLTTLGALINGGGKRSGGCGGGFLWGVLGRVFKFWDSGQRALFTKFWCDGLSRSFKGFDRVLSD